jgi:atypical dual specificity phosphatase
VERHLFDWLVPGKLGACAHPAFVQGLVPELRALRIGLVVNLCEQPDSPELLKLLSAQAIHLPVPDFEPPTEAQLARGVAAITEALRGGTRVAVHCAAGLGRTGTLLAAYLVAEGHTPDESIARVRAVRPGSIETAAQVRAVHNYARRFSQPPGAEPLD